MLATENQVLYRVQQLLNFDRDREETVTAQDSGRHELTVGNKVVEAKQRHFTQFNVILKPARDDASVSRSSSEINEDQVWPKPMRDVKGKGGVVFLTDGIFTGSFKTLTHGPSDTRAPIDQQDFFPDLHEMHAGEHRLCQQSRAEHLRIRPSLRRARMDRAVPYSMLKDWAA
jgi:hypothetical protein